MQFCFYYYYNEPRCVRSCRFTFISFFVVKLCWGLDLILVSAFVVRQQWRLGYKITSTNTKTRETKAFYRQTKSTFEQMK